MLQHCFNLPCDTAYSGEEAIDLVERRLKKLHKYGCSEYYQLILTDINMPEMDGIQMTMKIRKIYSDNEFQAKSQDLVRRISFNERIRGDDCIIWAVTAMNETELENRVGNHFLNGISVKPMSVDSLSTLLFSSKLINTPYVRS